MLTYNTTLPFAPPPATPAPGADSPFSYGSSHGDFLRAQMGARKAAYDLEASKAATQYAQRQQDAERQLVLQGLQQMDQAQQNQNSLANARMGAVNSLLSGLYR
jgi:hypothetical protein